MKKNNFNQNSIGTLPVADHVVTTLADASGKNIYESYIYKTGFFRFNWHPSIEILIVLKGQVKVYMESGIFNLCTNDVTVINNNVGHATMNEEPGTIAAAIHISYEFLSELCGFSPLFSCVSNVQTRDYAVFRSIRSCFANIYLALSTAPDQKAYELHALSQIYLLTSTLLHHFSEKTDLRFPATAFADQQKKFQNMIKYIGHNFRNNISLSDIANIADMNPAYTSVFFKSHIGIGFYEYLTRKRLEYAAYMINNTHDTLLEIALSAGFPDAKAFSRAFKKYFNITPRQYRNLINMHIDSNVSSSAPIRLTFDDPFVLQKLQEYDSLHTLPH